MSDIMRPIPFGEILNRILSEYDNQQTVFGIHQNHFFKPKQNQPVTIFGESCDVPIGPAAGPHTQLAQNIITAYLAGGRFIELKTVQQLDRLEIEKPCIDPEDECYNTEWSTELTVEQAFDEYLKAWMLLHLLKAVFDIGSSKDRSFIFNMSVGYDLAGVQTPKMDTFLNQMIDASKNPVFSAYLEELDSFVSVDEVFKRMCRDRIEGLKNLSADISPNMCKSVTLSTMHGCPPEEIEAICSHLMKTKGLNTYVKLNPTLLGYGKIKTLLNRIGFGYVQLRKESFDRDLQYRDAIQILTRMTQAASGLGLRFGVKLTNTLGALNHKGVLPGEEMYMSGRPLFPISIQVAAKLSEQFNGALPVSYSGGAFRLNVAEIYQCGIQPITMVTEILKPGGYLRLKDCAEAIENVTVADRDSDSVDAELLNKLASESLLAPYVNKQWRGYDQVQISKKLPIFDCYQAPCITACPIQQDIPDYIRLVAVKQYDRALELIYDKNPLPAITGHICDHQCMYNCTRLDYEGAVEIREMKRIATENGWKAYRSRWAPTPRKKDVQIAIVGAGPAGLAAAYFLSKEGFQVTVFEKQLSAGGVVHHVLPRFRIPEQAILQDIQFIEAHGVHFSFGVSHEFKIADLRSRGYTYICLAIGAELDNSLNLPGKNHNRIDSLKFLKQFHQDPNSILLGPQVVVLGGGNTAMDSARAALKVKDVESVTVLYRRSEAEMPADREEYEEALSDGVKFRFLSQPEYFGASGALKCRIMKLGEDDDSGRPRPIPTNGSFDLSVNTLITATGEHVDQTRLERAGLRLDTNGFFKVNPDTLETEVENVFLIGDAHTGPSTVVQAIAEAQKAAAVICKKEAPNWQPQKSSNDEWREPGLEDVTSRRGKIIESLGLEEGLEKLVQNEGLRCLECQSICNKCVEVCPNRANIALPVSKDQVFKDPFQILHIDAYCNECGNCERFCPYDGLPYKHKFTIFNLEEDYRASGNNGFLKKENEILLRLDQNQYRLKIDSDGSMSLPQLEADDRLKKVYQIIDMIRQKYAYLLGRDYDCCAKRDNAAV